MGALIALLVASGCVSSETPAEKSETPASSIPQTVIAAPGQLYIHAGDSEMFTFRSHNISINYTSAYPLQIVNITIDGSEKRIQKELAESPKGVYWTEKNLSLTLKPVVWEIRNSQKIPVYEKTWNTTELYFEAIGGDE